MEISLLASLVEKEVLLREINHWVENNLAAIQGLIEMEWHTSDRALDDTLIKTQGFELNIKLAFPCGLIVNELVTNALKYAFPKQVGVFSANNDCEIRVNMQVEVSTYTLTISDNGIGSPKQLDWRQTNTR